MPYRQIYYICRQIYHICRQISWCHHHDHLMIMMGGSVCRHTEAGAAAPSSLHCNPDSCLNRNASAFLSYLYFNPYLYFYPYLYLRDSASSFHWLSSSIFSYCRRRSFVRPASVNSPLISTIWYYRAYKPYIFCEDIITNTQMQKL